MHDVYRQRQEALVRQQEPQVNAASPHHTLTIAERLNIRRQQIEPRRSRDALLHALYSLEEFQGTIDNESHALQGNFGDKKCSYCNAFLFDGEESGQICCIRGKVKLAPLNKLPPELHQLFISRNCQAVNF